MKEFIKDSTIRKNIETGIIKKIIKNATIYVDDEHSIIVPETTIF